LNFDTNRWNFMIYNSESQLVYQSDILNSKSIIDFSNKPKGVYIMHIFNGQAILTKKIVIE